MTPEAWIDVVKWIRSNWPHREIPDATIAVWWEAVSDLDAEQVLSALRTMASREFPPNGAQLRDTVAELDRDDPDYGAAWGLVRRALTKYGLHHEHRQADGIAWLEEQSPVVAEAVRRIGPDSLGQMSYEDEPTMRAQFRDIYRGVVRDATDAVRFAAIPTAGLKRLERGPRRIGEVIELPSGESRSLPEHVPPRGR